MRRAPQLAVLAAGAVLAASAAAPPAAADPRPPGRDIGRETLAENDGWASAEGGTTGGAAADDADVSTVRTWDELKRAVRGDHPKIVYVEGAIGAMTAADGSALACSDFADPEYDWDAYVEAFDPEHWEGGEDGPLAEARDRSYQAHREHVLLTPGSNTTIVGVGDASLTGGGILLESVENVIVRNLAVHDAYDCFPEWRGEDWDAEYDNIEVSRSRHVWLDHLTLTDGETRDHELERVYGAQVDRHDGMIDVIRGSDLVTVSWNVLDGHDKTMLIGNTDSNSHGDRGRLRVTVHHNHFTGLTQRVPRVRYGQVHVYNNHYTHGSGSDYAYQYSWGAGVESGIYAQNNSFDMAPGIAPEDAIVSWGGTALYEEGSIFGGRPVDLLGAYNAAHPDAPLSSDVGWEPERHGKIHPTRAVPHLVPAKAGAGRLR
ncbi:hypothetical protein O4J56_10325 [Nocardiopsis sp. RSe5-2]|uniref:Pectate lyase domain-containing protein n=1 Tax=Nocardiopsis endophytica TaxID=3018445 RepID=A0ABT4U3Z5_9ACTN|nr:hypothetical protein [Nocardiopsis endophytica]MDA2811032.1 hypothetical protein [Nocardiopsis endophytica]